jgi:hypothetical protein
LKKLCCSKGGSEHFWTGCRYLLKANLPLGLITARISGDTGPLKIFSSLDISRTPEEFPALLDNLNKPEYYPHICRISKYLKDFQYTYSKGSPAHLEDFQHD